MNIPKNVKIGYKDFEVNLVPNKVIDEDVICYGNINHNDQIINISSLYGEDQQKMTFIHECLHGIDDMAETDLTEDQVRKLAKGLYSFIKDNETQLLQDN